MATFIVTNTNDANAGSLRDAVAQANADADEDTIVFALAAGSTITLGTELLLTSDITIDGDVNGDNKADITLSGGNTTRIVQISNSGTDVDLKSLTLTNGNAGGDGGAIFIGTGAQSLDILDTTVRNSVSQFNGGGLAAAYGTVRIVNSLFQGNSSAGRAGGIYADSDSMTLVNTTVSGNQTNDSGGGIHLGIGSLTLHNSTVTLNRADVDGSSGSQGGGIGQFGFQSFNVTNSVISGNTSGSGNASNDTSGSFTNTSSFIGGDALLGGLLDNGGTVRTHAALAASPLINAGNSALLPADDLDADGDGNTAEALPRDGRGVVRVLDGQVDIGAVENTRLVVTTAADVVNAGDGLLSLREAVAQANGDAAANTIEFAAELAGSTITLTTLAGGELGLFTDMTIDGDVTGDNRADIAISGANANRIFRVFQAQTDVDLKSLTLTNGRANGSGGAILVEAGAQSLDILDTTVQASVATFSGGGLAAQGGTVRAVNVLFHGNIAAAAGGGVYTGSSAMTLVNTTLSGNTTLDRGGGIYSSNSTLYLSSTTMTLNRAATTGASGTSGGGLYVKSGLTGAINSVISGNTSGSGNAVNDTVGSFINAATLIGGNAGLGSLSDNGGTVLTHAPDAGSPLIDAGGAVNLPTDFLDMDGDGNTAEYLPRDSTGQDRILDGQTDRGAVEGGRLVVTTAEDTVNAGDGFLSLREAITLANTTGGTQFIRFASNLANSVVQLTGTLTISQGVTIDGDVNGDDKADIFISGAGLHRIFTLTGGDTDLLSLGLYNGHADDEATVGGLIGSDGGAIGIAAGSLDLINSTVSGNTATGRGGGMAIANGVAVRVANSLLRDNSTSGYGGGIYTAGTALTLTNTTLHGNYTSNRGGGISAQGAAVTILSSTITGNAANINGANSTRGGAFDIFGGAAFTVRNSIVGENTSGNAGVLNDVLGAVATANNSVFSTATGGVANGVNGNVAGQPLGLGQLLDNGGTVLTRSPLDASVAIGAGNNTFLPLDVHDIDNDRNTTEQLPRDGRGDIRVRGTTTDAGAVEQKVDEVIRGTAAGDVILGGLGIDTLFGGLGNDTLDGGPGASDALDYSGATGAGVTVNLGILVAQLISAGEGSDTIAGIENITGSGLGDTLTGNGAANRIAGGLGNDFIAGGLGDDTLDGGANTDTVDWSSATGAIVFTLSAAGGGVTANTAGIGIDTISNFENMTGGAAGDTLTGNASANTIKGGGGDDLLSGGLGADTLDGEAGSDTVDWSAATAAIVLALSATGGGTINVAGVGADTILGIENIRAGSGADTLTGNDADNTFRGGLGSDSLTGGLGSDTADWSTATGAIVFTLGATGNGTTANVTGIGIDTITGIENLIGGSAADTLTGNGLNNRFAGGLGSDTLNGAGGTGDTVDWSAATGIIAFTLNATGGGVTANVAGIGIDTISNFENIIAGVANDTIFGNGLNNILEGRGGRDDLRGAAGNDTIRGGDESGAGDIFLSGDAGIDTVYGGLGDDRADGGTENDTLYGEAGRDYLTGNTGDDYLYGGDETGGGDTFLGGGAGNDRVYGGLGDDRIDGGADTDAFLSGDAGADYITGGDGDDRIDGGSENDNLNGEAGRDNITGGANNDTIAGGNEVGAGDIFLGGDAGIDYIYGGLGDDRIDGGADGDTLRGEDGADTITGGLGTDSLLGGAGIDYLEGGAANDTFTGGADADTFDFNPGTGLDSIVDFTNDIDTIRIDAGFGFANVAAVLARTIQSGNHARILLNATGSDSVYLLNFLTPGNGNTISNLADDIVIA